ncbi:MAG TPA: VWA domain-containing protein [Pyrinomonadaceae bacterium]|jgi:Ca-activated chloride channel family protein|nr:VWA domain-containing protein [Pyrinomonadaceae bacterium]
MMNSGTEKRLWPVFLLGVLAIFLSVPAARAQGTKDLPPPPPLWRAKPTPTPKPVEPTVIDSADVIRTSSNLVMVPVSVTDQTGQAVQGLKVEDFRLQEEGKQQEITGIGDPQQVPLAIALLFDISSSTSQKGFFASQQNAAAAFLRLVMKPADRAAIFTITGSPTMVQPLASAEASAAKMTSIPAATTSVPTAFYDSVIAAAKYLSDTAPSNFRRVIVVLSDGDDNYSEQIRDQSLADYRSTTSGQQSALGTRAGLQNAHQRAVASVQKSVQQADVIFYSVNPGGPSIKLNLIAMRAERGMETIAAATGGTAFVPDSDQDLERVFRQVAAELRGQYLLQYYGNSEAPANQFRRITVAVPARNDLRIRARQGYYPKKQD